MSQVRLRCQKGIPPALRGRAWLYLSGGKVKREQNQGKFQVSRTNKTDILTSPFYSTTCVLSLLLSDLLFACHTVAMESQSGHAGYSELKDIVGMGPINKLRLSIIVNGSH